MQLKSKAEVKFQIKIRTVRYPNEDILLEGAADSLADDVKKMIRLKKPELGDASIRLFYGGREILDNRTLGNYGYVNGTIIQAMIKS